MSAIAIPGPVSPGRLALVNPAPRPAVSCRTTRSGGRASRATYRRRRLAVALLAVGVVVAAGQAGGALGSSSLAAPERRPAGAVVETGGDGSVSVVVGSYDTLWSIATQLAPGEDPRPIVDALSEARHGAPLIPGETIRWSP